MNRGRGKRVINELAMQARAECRTREEKRHDERRNGSGGKRRINVGWVGG